MSKDARIVVEKYPVNRLPEDLRQRVGPDKVARLIIEAVADETHLDLVYFVGSGRGLYISPEEAVAAIRALRSEWE